MRTENKIQKQKRIYKSEENCIIRTSYDEEKQDELIYVKFLADLNVLKA